jgi:hypothetical protein
MSNISPLDSTILLKVPVNSHALDFRLSLLAVEIVDLMISSTLRASYASCLGKYLTSLTVEATINDRKPANSIAFLEALSFRAHFKHRTAALVTLFFHIKISLWTAVGRGSLTIVKGSPVPRFKP